MGFTKRLIDRQEHQVKVATQIALEAGVLQRCPYHETILDSGEDIEGAYRLGNARYSAGTYAKDFSDRREMTDAIKKAVEDRSDECFQCAKGAADD